MNSKQQLETLLLLLDDRLRELAEWSIQNDDLCLDEIMEMKITSESIKDQSWKIGVK